MMYELIAEIWPLALVVGVVLAVVWVRTFASLMGMPDDAFPGAHVRFGWVAAFVILWAFAPIAFVIWRGRLRAYASDRQVQKLKGKRRSKPVSSKKPAEDRPEAADD